MNIYKSRDFGRVTSQRHWTPLAVDCLNRGCNCEGCYYEEFFRNAPYKCQMKAAVVELMRKDGPPEGYIQKTIIEDTENEKEQEVMKKLEIIKKAELTPMAQRIVDNELSMLEKDEKSVAGLMIDGKNKHEIMREMGIQEGQLNPILVQIYKKTNKIVNYSGSKKHKKQEFVQFFLQGNIEEPKKEEMTDEWCPHCEVEVELPLPLGVYTCPSCGVPIVNCSMCEDMKCGTCELATDKKQNKPICEQIPPKNEQSTIENEQKAESVNEMPIVKTYASDKQFSREELETTLTESNKNKFLCNLIGLKNKYYTEYKECCFNLGHSIMQGKEISEQRLEKQVGDRLIKKIEVLEEIIADVNEVSA